MAKHVVVIRLEFNEEQWKALQKAARYHREPVRRVVQTEARLGVEHEIDMVIDGQREGARPNPFAAFDRLTGRA